MPKLSRRALLSGSLTAAGLAVVPGALTAAEIRLRPQAGIVRLSANENPYGPSPRALAAARRAVEHGAYYPGPIQQDLLAMIAEQNNLDATQLAISSGSNEALCAAMAAFGSKGKILAPELTYSPHLRYAEKIGIEVVRIGLSADMSIDLPAMAKRAGQGDIALSISVIPTIPQACCWMLTHCEPSVARSVKGRLFWLMKRITS
jgi:histidinol-phosphate aminotransferase